MPTGKETDSLSLHPSLNLQDTSKKKKEIKTRRHAIIPGSAVTLALVSSCISFSVIFSCTFSFHFAQHLEYTFLVRKKINPSPVTADNTWCPKASFASTRNTTNKNKIHLFREPRLGHSGASTVAKEKEEKIKIAPTSPLLLVYKNTAPMSKVKQTTV